MNANLSPTITFGFEVPQDGADIDAVRRVAIAAEAAGFADLWVSDSTGGGPSMDPLTLLPFLAGITSEVRLGVSVLVLPVHHPVHLSKRIATIDVLSGGRLTVGVGIGGGWDAAYGAPFDHRVGLFMDVFRATDALLRHEPARYHGSTFRLSSTSPGPKPLQDPRPPIWFGAGAEAALKRAARHGDGWMGSGGSDIESFERNVPILREELERRGRDPDAFPISKRVYFALDANPEGAVQRLGAASTRTVVWQNGDECAAYLERLIRAGANHVLLNPMYAFEEQLAAVVPTVHQLSAVTH